MGKKTAIDLTAIDTRAAALRALKRLGYTDPGYSMVRGAALRVGHGMSFQVAPGNFLVTDQHKHLTCIPMLRHVGNTADSANAQHEVFMKLIYDCGLVEDGVELPTFGLCVALAQLAVYRTEGKLVAVTGDTAEA
jgi:hypothetical protein